jgi:L-lactate dehydrogenase complex protein LldG
LSARDDILRALGAGPGLAPVCAGRRGRAPEFLAKDDWDTFAANLEAAGGRFVPARDAAEAKTLLAGLLEEIAAASAVRWDHPLLRALDLDGALQAAGTTLLSDEKEDFTARAARADLGLTSADALIAESGSLVVSAAPGRARSASLLPPAHLAVVGPGMMLADVTGLPSLVRALSDEAGRPPSALHLITGPSTTADIEQTLVRGIHGPPVLIVLAPANL